MVSGSIARRWAKALFSIGEEQGDLERLVREVDGVAQTWNLSDELKASMSNPQLNEKTRRSVLEAVVRRMGMSQMGRNFMSLLFDKSRLAYLPDIAKELKALADNRDNRLRAQLVTARPVGEAFVARLRSLLQRATGKSIVMSTSQDSSIIGGVVTTVGNVMYDGSLRMHLSRLKEEMRNRS